MSCQEGADTLYYFHSYPTLLPSSVHTVYYRHVGAVFCLQSVYEVHKHKHDWENNVIIESKCNQKRYCVFRRNLVCDLYFPCVGKCLFQVKSQLYVSTDVNVSVDPSTNE